MNYSVNQAIHIGHEHIFESKNLQDFCKVSINDTCIKGIICDGCSEGQHSEIGANLLGHLILENLIYDNDEISNYLSFVVEEFIRDLLSSLNISDIQREVDFIKNNLLCTFIFFIMNEDRIIIGQCGDGIIIVNDEIKVIEQNNKPHYIAYNNVPEEYLSESKTILEGINIISYPTANIERLVIASDGLKPLLKNENPSIADLYHSQKRQLQRRFNVWQQSKMMFDDDVSCIVVEKTATN
jgi:serine/threonine protein phosphatase PrpC